METVKNTLKRFTIRVRNNVALFIDPNSGKTLRYVAKGGGYHKQSAAMCMVLNKVGIAASGDGQGNEMVIESLRELGYYLTSEVYDSDGYLRLDFVEIASHYACKRTHWDKWDFTTDPSTYYQESLPLSEYLEKSGK